MLISGGDLVIGELGDNVDRVALGKGIQQMIVALGDAGRLDTETLRKVFEIVLGDGVQWDGVMQDLKRLRGSVEQLANKVSTLETKVNTLQTEMHNRRETSAEILWTLRITLGLVVAIVAVYIWQVW